MTFDNSLNPNILSMTTSRRLAFKNVELSASLFPVILISIVRPSEVIEQGTLDLLKPQFE